MIIEQELSLQKKPSEIFELLFQQNESPFEIENGITILYIGNKDNKYINQLYVLLKNNEISHNSNKKIYINFLEQKEVQNENNTNNLFLIKYKNDYIGGISINFNLREGFGLNKYINNSSFYLGQWKDNMKEGTGFLKIDNETLYIGSFHLNQFDGFGILYYKFYNIIYLGEFDNGSFNKGIYCNIDKDIYYRGKFNKNKKNDSFCTLLEKNNKHLFIGEVEDDVFIKGYLGLFQINEIKRQNEDGEDEFIDDFSIDKIFYYDKTNEKNIIFIHNFEFENEFKNKIINNMRTIFEVDYRTGNKIKEIIDYFNYLEGLVDDKDHNYLEKYNKDNEQSLESYFISIYNMYFNLFLETQENLDINEIRN